MTTIIHTTLDSATTHFRDRRSRSTLPSMATGETAESGSPIPKDQGSRETFKLPSITFRASRYADIQAIDQRWESEGERVPNIAIGYRMRDAEKTGNLDYFCQHHPLLVAALQNMGKTKKRPPLKIPDLISSESFEDPESKRSRKTRTGDPERGALEAMISALAEVTGSDVDVCRTKLKRTANRLLAKTQPYTPDEVHDFKDRVWPDNWRSKNSKFPELAEVEQFIGHVRLLPAPAAAEQPANPERATVEGERRPGGEVNIPPEPSKDVIHNISPVLSLVAVDDCGPGGQLVTAVDPVEVTLLGYAVEAATGVTLSLDTAAADEVRKLAVAGYRAENVAEFLQVIWPETWQGRATDFKGNPKTPERPAFKDLRSGLAHTRHRLQMTVQSGPDAAGKELQYRLELIRERVATGEPISLIALQSAHWDPLANRYERGTHFNRAPVEDCEPEIPGRPALKDGRAVSAWAFMLDQLEFRNRYAGLDARHWLTLVEVIEGEDADTFVVEASHRLGATAIEGPRLCSVLEGWLAEHYQKPVRIQLDEIYAG